MEFVLCGTYNYVEPIFYVEHNFIEPYVLNNILDKFNRAPCMAEATLLSIAIVTYTAN